MKLVNEKGKLFGIINLVDLVVVLCVLLIGAAVVIKFVLPAASDVVSTKSEMVVTLRVRGAMPYLKDEVDKMVKPGDKLVAGSDFVAGAEVVSVETDIPYRASISTADGKFVPADDAEKYDLIFTIKSPQSKSAPIYKVGNQEIRVGRGFTFKTQTIELNTIIETVEFNG